MDDKDALNEQEPSPYRSNVQTVKSRGWPASFLLLLLNFLSEALQTSLTLGNAKSICFFAINDPGTSFTIQVNALRISNYFLIDLERVQDACYYVFVVLNKPDVPPDYYIVPGCDLRSDPAKFGKWFADCKKMPGFIRKTSQSIATTGKFLTRNRGIRTEPNSTTNFPDLEPMSVRVQGKKLFRLG